MFISLDLETTGFDPKKDKIIEFGAIKFDLDGKKETLQFLVNPGITLPQIITHITSITDKDLKDAPKFTDKIEEIKAFIGDLPIIGHNIQFDINFLVENNIEIKNPLYDTFKLSGVLLPSLPSYSLEILSSALNLKHKEKHRALDDAIAAMELFLTLSEIFQNLEDKTIKRIHSLCEKTTCPLKDLLLSLNHQPSTKTFVKETKKPSIPSDVSEELNLIINEKNSALFETTPPYIDLIAQLSTKIDKDSYIAIPNQMFKHAGDYLPEEICKIDSPEKYISLKRLEEFENKRFFEEYEFSALLKYIIWTNQTSTGHLNEITLFNEEKITIHQINIDENISNPEEEYFYKKALEKDVSSATVCSHDYIIESQLPNTSAQKIKELLIFDLEKFTKTLFFKTSGYIKLEILLNQLRLLKELHPENKTIESLISKSTILFGLIGMIFEKYNDQNQFIKRVIVSSYILETKEWKDAVTSFTNLFEISKELSEINNEKTHGLLQAWKNSLKNLQEILLNPNLENLMIHIEEDFFEGIVIKSSPLFIKNSLNKILNNCDIYKIISENLNLQDNGEFIKKSFGLEEKIPLYLESKKQENIKISIFRENNEEKISLKTFLKDLLIEKKGSTAIIFNSKEQLKYFTLEIGRSLHETPIKIVSQLTGSLGKLQEQFKKDPENSVLFITPNFWENFQNYELINTLIIHKIPFDPPSDPFIITMSKNFQDPFMEFQIPKAIFALKKLINSLNTSDQEKKVIILDDRIVTKDYGKKFMQNIENLEELTP